MNQTAIVVGATGLVGGHLIREILATKRYQKVYAITRRSLALRDARLTNIVMEFEHLAEFKESLASADAFCALGTTRKKAGSREAFTQVDFTYPMQFARLCKKLGCEHFLVVSALGADAKSPFFYNRIKGELEEALGTIGFARLTIVRPSLLLGERGERRPFESMAALFSPLMCGPLRPYQGIAAGSVAHAMVSLAGQISQEQMKIVSSLEMQKLT